MKSYGALIKFSIISKKSLTSRHKRPIRLQVKTLSEPYLLNLDKIDWRTDPQLWGFGHYWAAGRYTEGENDPPEVNLRVCSSSSGIATGQTSGYTEIYVMQRLRVTKDHRKLTPWLPLLHHSQVAHCGGISPEFPIISKERNKISEKPTNSRKSPMYRFRMLNKARKCY